MWTEEVKIIFHFVLSVLHRLMTEVSVLSEIINKSLKMRQCTVIYWYPQAFMQTMGEGKKLKV